MLLVLDGVDQLLEVDEPASVEARRLLGRLAVEGPPLGVHLLVTVDPDDDEEEVDRLPIELATVIVLDPTAEGTPVDGVMRHRGSVGVRMRVTGVPPHERAVIDREAVQLASAAGFHAVPQVLRGDRAAELSQAPLRQLEGDAARRAERRTPRLWLGEPVGLGPPVEVLLRRRDGANLVVVAEESVLGSGVMLAATVTAALVHDAALEVWAIDFQPLEDGFGTVLQSLGDRIELHLGRRRTMAKILDGVHRIVQDRLSVGEVAGPPRLLVVNGLARARDLDARVRSDVDGIDPVPMLEAIVRDGPEVGVHTLVWSETVDLLDRRLGLAAVREFGLRVATMLGDAESEALLDTPAAAHLRPGQAVLYDEDRGRVQTFRPYRLPAPGWRPPPRSTA